VIYLTIEDLQKRQKELETQMQTVQDILVQSANNITTIKGAMMENAYWIGKLEKEAQDANGNETKGDS
jgi:3-deoxy-D-arabino-heptulosonate 7-phosphate (DAHP) synthase